jgi:Zn-dependent metalloprotease
LQQVYKGISVSGGHIVIEVDSNFDVFSINGHYYPQVRLAGISIEPAIDKNRAQAIVEEDLAREESFISKIFYPTTYEFSSVFLIVDMVRFEKPELVWEMKLYIDGKTWKYFIHAQTGEIIDKFCNDHF